MEETKRILDQLKRAYNGEAWHGPPLRDILLDVTAEQAAAHPLPNAHSIWELVLHIAAWENAARDVLEGRPINVPPEVNFPPIPDPSEAAWHDALTTLDTVHHGLRAAINRITDDDLNTLIGNTDTGRRYSIYILLHGVVQHDLYHAGQIVMLKKALNA